MPNMFGMGGFMPLDRMKQQPMGQPGRMQGPGSMPGKVSGGGAGRMQPFSPRMNPSTTPLNNMQLQGNVPLNNMQQGLGGNPFSLGPNPNLMQWINLLRGGQIQPMRPMGGSPFGY